MTLRHIALTVVVGLALFCLGGLVMECSDHFNGGGVADIRFGKWRFGLESWIVEQYPPVEGYQGVGQSWGRFLWFFWEHNG